MARRAAEASEPTTGASERKRPTSLSARRIATWFFAVVCLLHLVNAGAQVLKLSDVSFEGKQSVVDLLVVNNEGLLATWYSVISLMICAVLACLIAREMGRTGLGNWRWLGLGIIFTAMSFDEHAELHPRLGSLVDEVIDASGPFYFTWVVAGAAFTVLFAAVYLSFVLRLPRSTRAALIAGGAVYVAGALGIEMWTGVIADRSGDDGALYAAVASLEEFFEMSGIVLVIYGLCLHLASLSPLTYEIASGRFPTSRTDADEA